MMDAADPAAAPSPAAGRERWWRVRPILVVAFFASLAIHVAVTMLADEDAGEPESIPLAATIRELPPPPSPGAAPAPPAPRKPASRPRVPAAVPSPAPSPSAPASEADAAPAAQAPSGSADTATTAEAATEEEEPPVLAEDVPASEPPVAGKTLPPRVDLAYRVFYGTGGLWIGSATYRFEHAENRYRIATVGEARGLAALLFRGRGRMESKGLITRTGLQPHEFVVDKFNRRGAERADFDWETGIATLHGDKTAALELPTFDILALMWQFYFQPPQEDRQTFALATTRRVNRVTVARERAETIEWGQGPIDTEVWRRTSEDGRTEAYVWLAPSLRWLPVKMRVVNTTRGTVEALLAEIRVDQDAAAVGADVERDTPPEPPLETAAPDASGAPASVPGPGYDNKP